VVFLTGILFHINLFTCTYCIYVLRCNWNVISVRFCFVLGTWLKLDIGIDVVASEAAAASSDVNSAAADDERHKMTPRQMETRRDAAENFHEVHVTTNEHFPRAPHGAATDDIEVSRQMHPAPGAPSAGLYQDHTQSPGRQVNAGLSGATVHEDAAAAVNSLLVVDTGRLSLAQSTTASALAGMELRKYRCWTVFKCCFFISAF